MRRAAARRVGTAARFLENTRTIANHPVAIESISQKRLVDAPWRNVIRAALIIAVNPLAYARPSSSIFPRFFPLFFFLPRARPVRQWKRLEASRNHAPIGHPRKLLEAGDSVCIKSATPRAASSVSQQARSGAEARREVNQLANRIADVSKRPLQGKYFKQSSGEPLNREVYAYLIVSIVLAEN